MMKKNKILILDSNAIIHRSFHALPPLTSPKGEQINAVYGFVLTLLRSIKDLNPTHIVACFDAGRLTFRNELYDKYKANRKKTDEGLISQIPRVWEFLASLSIPTFSQKGVEADDLVGSIAKIAEKKDFDVYIVTGDKDALQLVNDRVKVYSLHRGVNDTLIYDPKTVKEKMGVAPEKVVLFKALSGDSSDNIPGVPGVGPKTAVELIDKYNDKVGIYKNLDKVSERISRLFKENEESLDMSYKLATIVQDLKVDVDFDKARLNNFHFENAIGFLNDIGFKSLINKLPRPVEATQEKLFFEENQTAPKSIIPFNLIKTESDWQKYFEQIKKAKEIVIDTETIDLNGPLIGISFATNEKEGYYLAISPPSKEGVALENVRADLQKILSNGEIKKIGHNIKYDLATLRRTGFEVEGIYFDTMIASSLINTQLFSNKLDDVSLVELGFRKTSLKDLLGGKDIKEIVNIPAENVASYSVEDAVITYRLYQKMKLEIETEHLKKIFYEFEIPLIEVLEKMEATGIKIDKNYLIEFGLDLDKKIEKIKKDVFKISGEEFNINSPAQLKTILFDKLHLPTSGLKKTKTGISTDAESLEKLKSQHAIIALILENRELAKLNNTYIKTLPELCDKNDRVHTSFNQIGTITGRLSSSNPNLQNIPIKTELGTAVRRAFIAEKNKTLFSADYSQIELRIVAHLSADPGLCSAFNEGRDIHQAVADELKIERRAAKAINFGIIYGLGPNGLANDLSISVVKAREFIDRYFAEFGEVANFIEKTKRTAKENGFVQTLFGRRRYLSDINSGNPMLRSAAERMAVNMTAQGTVADLMKRAMIKIAENKIDGATMLLQIHDELLFEVEPAKLKSVTEKVQKIMDNALELRVPLIVSVKSGQNWADMK